MRGFVDDLQRALESTGVINSRISWYTLNIKVCFIFLNLSLYRRYVAQTHCKYSFINRKRP